MRYVMKQKLFCWGDDFTIKDDTGTDRFFVDGKAFSLGKQLSFQDMQGRELVFIRQKLLAWGPTYEIYRDNGLFAVVKKELFTFFHCRFTVDVPGPDDLENPVSKRFEMEADVPHPAGHHLPTEFDPITGEDLLLAV